MTIQPSQLETLSYADPSVRGGRSVIVRGLAVVVAVALSVALLTWRIHSTYERQRQLMTTLNQTSGGMTVETNSFWHGALPARLRPYFDRVREVDLSACYWNGRYLREVAAAASVRDLNLSTRPVQDSELAELAPLSGLHVLRVDGSRISDASAPVLAALENLQLLDVRDTALTDASVPFLSRLMALRDLRLEGTQITRAGVKRLRAALPGCAIDLP
jgi:hypothetical protein